MSIFLVKFSINFSLASGSSIYVPLNISYIIINILASGLKYYISSSLLSTLKPLLTSKINLKSSFVNPNISTFTSGNITGNYLNIVASQYLLT